MNKELTITNLPLENTKLLNAITKEPIRWKNRAERLLFLAVFTDLLVLNLCFLAVVTLQNPLASLLKDHSSPFLHFGIFINLSWIVVASFTNVYRTFDGFKLVLKIRDLFLGTLVYFGLVSLVYYPYYYDIFQIHFLLAAFLTFTGISSLTHLLLRYYSRSKSSAISYAVVGGDKSSIKYLNNVLESSYSDQTVFVGHFSDEKDPQIRRLGGFEDLRQYIKKHGYKVNKILYYESNLSKEEIRDIIQLCRNRFIDFEVVPKAFEFFEKGVFVEQLEHVPFFRRKEEPLCKIQNKLLKRAFDIVFSFLVILIIFPILIPLLALLIRLDSKGPIFFIQKRTGYWNKPFKCLKFRSMTVNKDSDTQQATKGDRRITKIGAFLRRTNLDEIPQFFNVLKGDMSIVGPRPHMLKHTEDYSKLIDNFMIRHEVKPGITGWAQVNGWRGPTEEVYKMVKRVEYDVDYIESWSFWWDIKIVLLTVFNAFKGEENAH